MRYIPLMKTCPYIAGYNLPKRKPTWKMSPEQLARVWARHHGIHSHRNGGGWLYDQNEKPYVQGWTALAKRLTKAEIIEVGKGVSWSRDARVERVGWSS